MCTAHYVLFRAPSIIINTGSHHTGRVHESPPRNTRTNMTSARLVICAVDHMFPQSHTFLFSTMLSAAFFSMTVFAALKRTSFYDRPELGFD